MDHTQTWCNTVSGGWGNCVCNSNPTAPPPPPPPPPTPPPTPTQNNGNCAGTRVRRSWYVLSFAERTTYTTAFQRLVSGAAGNSLRQRYIALIDSHMRMWTASSIHEMRNFLPWHRWYLIQMENLLREIDCTITIP